mgnify:CR=1 FL=1
MNKKKNTNCRMEYLSSNMKLLRKTSGMSQEQISEKLNIIRSTYAYYESGSKVPDLQTIDSLASLYDIELDVLINHDLSKGIVNRIYFDESSDELADVLNDFQKLSASSQKLIMERMETLLERENALFTEYTGVREKE